MASLKLVKSAVKARPMWLYPEVVGFNPSERWGHSACFADGILYVFGGCCGGLHFSDVLTMDLKNMAWSSLATTGQQPGTRDSHSGVLFGQRIIVFGGTNGSKKINDLHILDLKTKEWTRPTVQGRPPAPRESHSATLFDDNKLIIFAGSGEGEGNYMNDVHVLDLNSMSWTSPEVKGELPARRDSHTAVAVDNKLVVYGGDCGDHYLGEVDVLDLATFTWSRLETEATACPGVRAGHASVAIGSKVYIVGGVGDRAYYNDIWTLDMGTHAWAQLDVGGTQPQGRFSHSAVLADSTIVVYGGCGEDEHPLDEIVLLHLGSEYSTGSAFSTCKFLANPCSSEHWRLSSCRKISAVAMKGNGMVHASDPVTEISGIDHTTTKSFERKTASGGQTWNQDANQHIRRLSESEEETKPRSTSADDGVTKRRKVLQFQKLDLESEQEEHSHSLSQQSSPSQSDQEQSVQKRNKVTLSQSAEPLELFSQEQPQNSEHQPKQRRHPYMHQFPLYQQNFDFRASQVKLDYQHPQQQQPKVDNVLSVPSLQFKMRLPHLPAALPLHGSSQTPQVQFLYHDPTANVPDAALRNYHHGQLESPAFGEKQHRVAVTGVVAVPNLVGSQVRGTVDAVFDSGYLMTAQVNDQVFRGLLFSPGSALGMVRDANMLAVCNAPVNNHVASGFITSHHPYLPAHTPSAQNNLGSITGNILGSPLISNIHPGTVIQPTNWNRLSPVALASDNRIEGSGPHLGLMLRSPGQNATEMPRQIHGIPDTERKRSDGPSKTLGPIRRAGDEMQGALHSRTASTIHTKVEGVGHPQPIFAGSGGHWVWHPLPPPSPITHAVILDENSSNPSSSNVQFVAVPPFPGFGIAQPEHDTQKSIFQSKSVPPSSNPANGALSDIQPVVTLSLGGPG